jgi:lipoprotein-anchoring transpeptidase ErfK/SrfK
MVRSRSPRSAAAVLCVVLVALAVWMLRFSTPDSQAALARQSGSRLAGAMVAHVIPGRIVKLREQPFGRVVAEVGAQTVFGSPSVLAVERSQGGRWLAVRTPLLANGRLGWVDARAGGLTFSHSPVELEVDLSRRQLRVRVGHELARVVLVGVGRDGSPTPTGRFAVTDKLPGSRYGAVYGCCILALSGHQTHLPAGWQGGSRLAIHGSPNDGDTGRAVSAGCLHASANDLSFLMRRVPLGSRVVIHP